MKRIFPFCSLLAVALAACAQPAPPPAAAAPPPPPPPPAQHDFIVFFGWNSAVVTPDARQIVMAAASASKSGPPGTVMVTGYTDTSGTAAYNQKLSVRRADNVAAALARAGVPRNELEVSGRGENDLRVPTPPGVREPHNRRVEIVEGGAAPPPAPPAQ
jgi:OmpA-OmpF porin, OOP family